MVLSDLHAGVGGRPAHLLGATAADLMRAHHEVYAALSPEEIANLTRRGILKAAEKSAAKLGEASQCHIKIKELQALQSTPQLPGLPCTVDASRYPDEWVARFVALFETLGCPGSQWTLEGDRASSPMPPAVESQEAILRKVKEFENFKPPPRTSWARTLIKHRETFLNCVICVNHAHAEVFDPFIAYIPLHVCQQPEDIFSSPQLDVIQPFHMI